MTHWQLDAAGWLIQVERIPSPNFDARPDVDDISLVVVHAISLPPGEYGGDGVARLFTNRLEPEAHPYYAQIQQLKVSAHFFVRRDGSVIQFVSCLDRAWHAGVSCWQERERCNDFSIGIELEGCDEDTFDAAQYRALNELIVVIGSRYPIRAVVGHSDIAPGRKTDPGPYFDWELVKPLPSER